MEKLNNLLEKQLSIRVVKSISHTSMRPKRREGPPIIIEFIGASGVGKTTLCDYYLKNFNEEKLDDISIFKNYQYYSNATFKAKNIYNELFSNHIRLIGNLNKTGEQMLETIRFSKTILVREIAIQKYLKRGVFFLEEGIFHIFGVHFDTISNKYNLSTLAENRLLIYCTASPDFVFNNIKKRNRQSGIHAGKSDEDIMKNVTKTLNDKKEILGLFQSMNIPILTLNTEDKLDDNCQKIKRFLSAKLTFSQSINE